MRSVMARQLRRLWKIQRSDLARALNLGGPVHSTNYTRRQEWVPAVLQCWGWWRAMDRYFRGPPPSFLSPLAPWRPGGRQV
jgi:hypothetical protein